MGGNHYSSDAYNVLKQDYSTKTRQQIFTNNNLDAGMDPKGLKFRESRDSTAHPNSVAVAVFLDETGSMGDIPHHLVTEKLGALMETLISHGVPDAHVLFGGVGDHYRDTSPIQVGQFEAGTEELNTWLTKIYLEGNGGGNQGESYSLAWLIAGRHTSIDCYEKRQQKGFLFTIGDEPIHPKLEGAAIENLMGYSAEDVSTTQLLEEAQRMYHVFHINAKAPRFETGRINEWKGLLGERFLVAEDPDTIPELIASTVAVTLGADLANVVASFDKGTAGKVTTALAAYQSGIQKKTSSEGVIKL